MEQQHLSAVHTSARPDRMVHGTARTPRVSVLYVDGVPIGVVGKFELELPMKVSTGADKFGGSFLGIEPRGAEDPGNSPDVRA